MLVQEINKIILCLYICMFHNMFHVYFQLSVDKELFLSLYVLLV